MKTNSRCWTAYEKNQLLSKGLDISNLDQYGDKPVEYITNKAHFFDLEFVVDERVLIPRLESQGLVNLATAFLQTNKSNKLPSCFEVGTGSGCIGISIFLRLPVSLQQHITFFLSDISRDCLAIASINLRRLVPLSHQSQINLLHSNLLSTFPQLSPSLIVANLPYVPSALLSILDDSVKYFEPNLALDGGEDGLKLVRELIEQAIVTLSPTGVLLLEVDERASISRETLSLYDPTWRVLIIADEFQKQRYLIIGREPVVSGSWWPTLCNPSQPGSLSLVQKL